MSGAPSGPADVPRAVLRGWDEAEARLFPLVMTQPELYQRSLELISGMLDRLRETCPDVPALLAANERGGDLVAELLPPGLAPGISADLVAAAACAMRYREQAAAREVSDRLAALARARAGGAGGAGWVVAGESGTVDRAPYIPYQRIEVEVASGRAVIVSIEPDETLTGAVHRLDLGEVDLVTGELRIGAALGSYRDPDAAAEALRQAKRAEGLP